MYSPESAFSVPLFWTEQSKIDDYFVVSWHRCVHAAFLEETKASPVRELINGRKIIIMAKIVKVIELMSESPKSWEDAAQAVVQEASKTLRNIRSVYVKEFTAAVENDKVTSYRINAKVTFEMER
jgi:flavin-binding protein dodecin